MSKEKINIITKLINSVNLRNLNLSLINKNCNYLYELQKDIKTLWSNKKHEHIFLKSNEDNYKNIFKITKNSLLGDYPFVINELKKTNKKTGGFIPLIAKPCPLTKWLNKEM